MPIDGFANGWRVGAGCREARFEFRPQRLADVGYAISAVGCFGMLGVLLLALRRRRRSAPPLEADPLTATDPKDPLRRFAWPLALGAGVVIGGVAGFLFGLRAGVLLGPGAAALLVMGVSARRLLAIATVALAAIPVVYVADPAPRPRGLSFTYATHHLGAHWLAVVAICCLAGAAGLEVARLRSSGEDRGSHPDKGAGAHEERPGAVTSLR